METVDEEFLAAALAFIERQSSSKTPFFCWFNTTHMHILTHTKPEYLGQARRWQSPCHDTMIDQRRLKFFGSRDYASDGLGLVNLR